MCQNEGSVSSITSYDLNRLMVSIKILHGVCLGIFSKSIYVLKILN